MVGATLNGMLDGSHYAKKTATRFQFIVVENKPYKDVRTKGEVSVLVQIILKAVYGLYFISTIPEILSLLFRLKKFSVELRKIIRSEKFTVQDHKQYTSLRNLVDSMNDDIEAIKSMRDSISGRRFPLKGRVLKELTVVISLMDNYMLSVEKYLKGFNKPVLPKFGNKVMMEAKQWKSRVKAYDFIA